MRISVLWGSNVLTPVQRGTVVFALYYGLQLASFRCTGELATYFPTITNFGWKHTEYWAQLWQIGGTLLGALLGGWYLRHQRKYHWHLQDSIRRTLVYSSILLTLGVVLVAWWMAAAQQQAALPNWVYWCSKALFGAGWACGIGAGVLFGLSTHGRGRPLINSTSPRESIR